jgi:hypothetical protein
MSTYGTLDLLALRIFLPNRAGGRRSPAIVDLDADALRRALLGDVRREVVVELVGDRDPDHLHRRQPGREGPA